VADAVASYDNMGHHSPTHDRGVRGGLTAQEFHFGDYTLDQSAYRLQRGQQLLRLEKLPMELLILLVRRHGELISREEIAECLWGKDVFVDVDHSINTAVRKIRLVLRDDSERPRFLETVVGKGYRFAARVQITNGDSGPIELPDLAAEVQPLPTTQPEVPKPLVPATQAAALPPTQEKVRSPRLLLLLGSFSFLAVLAVAILLNRGRQIEGVARPPIKSLAVLPLKNLSGDATQEYFADGMTEAVIGRLSLIPGLRVISRTSVMRFKDTRMSTPEIAKMLHVDAVVEGSVVRERDRIRVNAQLIRGATDEHIWAGEYQRESQSILALQEEIARTIARQIRVSMKPPQPADLAATRTVDPKVQESYLKGRYYFNQRTEDALNKSIAYFAQAVEKDPSYPLPYCGLADAYAVLGYRGHLLSRDALLKAKSAALKAIELDDTVADAHASLAFIAETLEWNWATAEREYKRALELNPSDARAHHWYAGYLIYVGRFDEGIEEAKLARDLDPLSLPINTALAGRMLVVGRYDEAFAQLRETLEMDPNFPPAHNRLAWAYLGKGKQEAAIREFQKALDLSQIDDPDLLLDLGFAYAISGERDEALKILSHLKRQHERNLVPSGAIAILYGALGERNQAFAWLEKAYAEHDPELTYVKVGPRFDPLRHDARFPLLVHRIGLPN
jgi:TolB-like protein/DNA-binding winged helix-turn-helix (wHTH) protein/Tfp pilus assembly protein PilF